MDKVNGAFHLTPREQQLLRLIWNGFSNKETASYLNLSVKTVEAYRANMMKKMKVDNTAKLIRTGLVNKLIGF